MLPEDDEESEMPEDGELVEHESAFRRSVLTYRLEFDRSTKDLRYSLQRVPFGAVCEMLEVEGKTKSWKYYPSLKLTFHKVVDPAIVTDPPGPRPCEMLA